jgi:hypothetical protein
MMDRQGKVVLIIEIRRCIIEWDLAYLVIILFINYPIY